MFNLQDIESLNKLAHILVWPLMAAAFYSSYGIFHQDSLPSPERWFYPVLFAGAFAIQAFAISVIVEAIDFALHLSSKLVFEWTHAVFGITMLTVGLLPLNNIGNTEATLSVSPLWAFACLAWGLRIFLPTKSG